jgi:NAD(P)-dependent dehydrogenase (short-subunit alcohol dehydrogenase family)
MSEDSRLTGRAAIVFGGSGGIGAAAARRLARGGANVGLTYVSAPDKAADTVRAIEEEGRTGFAIKADSAVTVGCREFRRAQMGEHDGQPSFPKGSRGTPPDPNMAQRATG